MEDERKDQCMDFAGWIPTLLRQYHELSWLMTKWQSLSLQSKVQRFIHQTSVVSRTGVLKFDEICNSIWIWGYIIVKPFKPKAGRPTACANDGVE
eukprot:scaffold83966_cov37-Tisochrysis_lutea.AAC.1